MAEKHEWRGKQANLGVISSTGLEHARQVRWQCRERNGESGFLWPGDIRNRHRWVKEWNDSVDCQTIEDEFFTVSKQLVGAMHHKYNGANDSQEREQAEEELMRVDLSSVRKTPRIK